MMPHACFHHFKVAHCCWPLCTVLGANFQYILMDWSIAYRITVYTLAAIDNSTKNRCIFNATHYLRSVSPRMSPRLIVHQPRLVNTTHRAGLGCFSVAPKPLQQKPRKKRANTWAPFNGTKWRTFNRTIRVVSAAFDNKTTNRHVVTKTIASQEHTWAPVKRCQHISGCVFAVCYLFDTMTRPHWSFCTRQSPKNRFFLLGQDHAALSWSNHIHLGDSPRSHDPHQHISAKQLLHLAWCDKVKLCSL